MSEFSAHRERLVVVGTIGSIGNAVCREFAADYDVVAVTHLHTRLAHSDPQLPVAWHYCDVFSRLEVQQALESADRAIYLVHTRVPSARLDQAQCEDMDLLIADNFARAARVCGLRHIVCLRGLLPKDGAGKDPGGYAGEVAKTLQSSGVPVSVIRAGLIATAGSATLNLIGNQVLGTRFVPIPAWALQPKQPIAERDFLRAVRYCLDDPHRFTGSFDIGGPEIMDWRQILQLASERLGTRPRFVTMKHLPRRIYARWMQKRSPDTYPTAIHFMVRDLACDATVTDNPLQQLLAPNLQAPIEAIQPTIENGEVYRLEAQRTRTMAIHKQHLLQVSSVRSIQRVKLPVGRDARWIAETYFAWLQRFAWPFLRCRVLASGSCQIRLRGLGLTLLKLQFDNETSTDNRRLYFIDGGVLASRGRNSRSRMEFRDVLDGRYTIIAIHDFVPALPWQFYLTTQAALHLVVMRAFRRFIARRYGELSTGAPLSHPVKGRSG